MGTKKILLSIVLVLALINVGYHVMGRERAPPQLVAIFDATAEGFTFWEDTVVGWVHESADKIVKELVPDEDAKAKQKLTET